MCVISSSSFSLCLLPVSVVFVSSLSSSFFPSRPQFWSVWSTMVKGSPFLRACALEWPNYFRTNVFFVFLKSEFCTSSLNVYNHRKWSYALFTSVLIGGLVVMTSWLRCQDGCRRGRRTFNVSDVESRVTEGQRRGWAGMWESVYIMTSCVFFLSSWTHMYVIVINNNFENNLRMICTTTHCKPEHQHIMSQSSHISYSQQQPGDEVGEKFPRLP